MPSGYAFERLCWVTIGQEPDLLALQRTLHIQLCHRPPPEAATTDVRVGLDVLSEAARGVRVLLVLDDIWATEHGALLSFVNEPKSVTVATTRTHSLVEGAPGVKAELLPAHEALVLLLRAGSPRDSSAFAASPCVLLSFSLLIPYLFAPLCLPPRRPRAAEGRAASCRARGGRGVRPAAPRSGHGGRDHSRARPRLASRAGADLRDTSPTTFPKRARAAPPHLP